MLIIGLAALARPYLERVHGDALVIVNHFPYLVCGACAVIAYQFGRHRLLLASAGVAALYWLIQNHLQVSLAEPDAGRLYLVASLALPLSTLYLLAMPERRITSLFGLLLSVCFVGLVGACFPVADWILRTPGDLAGWFAPWPATGYVLASGSTLMVAFAALTGLVLLMLRNGECEAAMLAVLASASVAMAKLHLDNISVIMASAAGLCVAWGLVRSSHAMAYRDELTGLLGRRALNERLNSLGRRYSIAMLDVDHFKRFNDTHGHEVGDEVLKFVASRVRQVGAGGTAYRYGGEEFCIVFPRRSSEDCAAALEEVRKRISDYRMSIRNRPQRPAASSDGRRKRGATRVNGKQVSVTVSAGVAARDESTDSPEKVLQAADSKLYRAKKAGRNKVVF